MKHSMLSRVLAGALLAGTFGAASAAQVYYTQPRQEYAPQVYAYQGQRGYEHEHDRDRHECAAPRWDANRRYMPGDTVVRKGELYRARGVSGHVYNVNSPPEWTPYYWAHTGCR